LDDGFRPSYTIGALGELSTTPSPNTSAFSLSRPVSGRPTRNRRLPVYQASARYWAVVPGSGDISHVRTHPASSISYYAAVLPIARVYPSLSTTLTRPPSPRRPIHFLHSPRWVWDETRRLTSYLTITTNAPPGCEAWATSSQPVKLHLSYIGSNRLAS
jgi:hypothetical protein